MSHKPPQAAQRSPRLPPKREAVSDTNPVRIAYRRFQDSQKPPSETA